MSGPGAWGFLGGTKRLMELPDTDDGERAPLARARLRYSRSSGLLEESRSRSAYQALGSDTAAVDNIAELQGLPDESLPDGYPVGMASLIDIWYLRKGGTETPDGITIVDAASGTAQWQRACLPSDQWRRQLDWWMDSVNGDDENVGDLANPIKTFEEFRRRHGKLLGDPTAAPAAQTFTILDTGDVEQDFIVDMRVRQLPETFNIYGSQSTIYSGSVTGYVPWNVAGQQEPQLTDVALPVSWTASGLVHKQMILTSGANVGATAYISRDLGAKTALMPLFLDAAAFSMVEPAGGDAFDVFEQTTIKGLVLVDIGDGMAWVELRDVEVDNSDAADAGDLMLLTGQLLAFRCAFKGDNYLAFTVCSGLAVFRGGMLANSSHNQLRGGLVRLWGPLMSMGKLWVDPGATLSFYGECTLDGCGSIDIAAGARVIVEFGDSLIVNCGAAVPFVLEPGASLEAWNILWGTTGNTPAYAFSLGNMATIAADVANLQIMGGTVNDILLGSAAAAYGAARPMVDAASEAKVLDRYNP